jgi:enoyl-CoA hydratase/carnithine racemase
MITTHQNGSTITVMLAARAINPLSRLFHRELAAILEILEARRSWLDGVIVGFHSEAADSDHELEHLMALTPAQAADCMHMLGAYNALLRRLESLGIPVIATLGGAVTGHALGLALACHRRISLADASFSLPQVQLGLTPVAGGIARTVRVTGLRAAMPLLLEGAMLTAAQALRAGLLHAVADDEAQAAQLVSVAIGEKATVPPLQPWDAKGGQPPGGGLDSASLQALLQVTPAALRERTGGHAPAPEAILCAMVEGLQVDFDSALLIESRYFCQTAISDVARNLMRLSQIRADVGSPLSAEFAATLGAVLDNEARLLRAEGVPEALLRNAARAAGLTPLSSFQPAQLVQLVQAEARTADAPPAEARNTQTPRAPQNPPDRRDIPETPVPTFDDIRDRLLYSQVIAALASVARGAPGSRPEADLVSVRVCGFPAHTGGAIRFVRHVGIDVFAGRAASLGPRFALPLGWDA